METRFRKTTILKNKPYYKDVNMTPRSNRINLINEVKRLIACSK